MRPPAIHAWITLNHSSWPSS